MGRPCGARTETWRLGGKLEVVNVTLAKGSTSDVPVNLRKTSRSHRGTLTLGML